MITVTTTIAIFSITFMTLLHVNIKVLLESLLDDVTLTQARIPKSTVGLHRS